MQEKAQAQQVQQAQAQQLTDKQIKQVHNALFNGNNKKQESGNIPQGFHNVDALKKQYNADKIPAGLPADADAVFIASNNIIAYTDSKGLHINKQAQGRLTDVQLLCVDWLKDITTDAGGIIADADIQWQGRAGKATDKAQAMASKVLNMMHFNKGNN